MFINERYCTHNQVSTTKTSSLLVMFKYEDKFRNRDAIYNLYLWTWNEGKTVSEISLKKKDIVLLYPLKKWMIYVPIVLVISILSIWKIKKANPLLSQFCAIRQKRFW